MKLHIVALYLYLLSGPLLFGSLFSGPLFAEAPIEVLKRADTPEPSRIMESWLLGHANHAFVDWESRYKELKTSAHIDAYQKNLRDQFVRNIGGFPDRTPLNAKETGSVKRKGYRVEKILYESRPGHYVTGLCFIPESDRFQPPYPAVLVTCGHSANGKAYEGYQTATAMLAMNGIIGFIIDPICQGERLQHLGEDRSDLVSSSTHGHTLIGLGAMLLGQNTARIEIWDAMRGIDYLQQRKDVLPDRIGCMGNSGGGTQTAYLMALDDRIKAASPACYLTTFERLLHTIGPQDAEQNIFGQLKWGMEHTDYLLMRAPTPILMCTATNDYFSIEGAWTSYRRGKRLYTRLGFPERISLAEVDEAHGWHQPLREAAVQWMVRWLAARDEVVREPVLKLLSPEETQVTPDGQVLWLPGACSVNQQQHEEFLELQTLRRSTFSGAAKAKDSIRMISGIRPLAEIPNPAVKRVNEVEVDDVTIESLVLTSDDGLPLPALLYRSGQPDKGPLLFAHQEGKQASFEIDGKIHSAFSYAKEGYTVLAIDPRGIGETAPVDATWYDKRFGPDGEHLAIAYLLGKNYVGMRAEDLLVASRWLQIESGASSAAKVELVCYGHLGTPGLHAAALEEQLFEQATFYRTLPSWEPILASLTSENQLVHCIHGAARVYDLRDLVDLLRGRAQMIEPIDAMEIVH